MSSGAWGTGETAESWEPAERTRRWLGLGTLAVLAAGCLLVTAEVLAILFWERDDLTPSELAGLLAILPEIVVLRTYLVLARDVGSRSLWKGAAGYFASGWAARLTFLPLDGAVPAVQSAQWIAAGAGIVGLAVLLVSRGPRLREPEGAAPVDELADKARGDGGGAGCAWHAVPLLIVFLLRFLVRGARRWLPAINPAENWQLLVGLPIGLLAVIFSIWFGWTKIRLRERLGGMSSVLGGYELFMLAVYLAGLLTLAGMIYATVAGQPNVDDAAIERLIEQFGRSANAATATMLVIWSVLTVLFFSSTAARTVDPWGQAALRRPSEPPRLG